MVQKRKIHTANLNFGTLKMIEPFKEEEAFLENLQKTAHIQNVVYDVYANVLKIQHDSAEITVFVKTVDQQIQNSPLKEVDVEYFHVPEGTLICENCYTIVKPISYPDLKEYECPRCRHIWHKNWKIISIQTPL